MTQAQTKTIQQLQDARALEGTLRRTLVAHIAITDRGEHRRLLKEHLAVTTRQERDITRRLADLGGAANPVQAVAGVAKEAAAITLTLAKGPADALRGPSADDVALRNAQDECASEALEIAMYDALEAIAEAAGDNGTAELARRHRAEEEAFLADLRKALPELARTVARTGSGGRRLPISPESLKDGARALALGLQTVIGRGEAPGPRPQDPGEVAAAQAHAEAQAKRPQRRAAKPAAAAKVAGTKRASATPKPSPRRPAAKPAAVKDAEGAKAPAAAPKLPKRAASAPRAEPPIADYDDMTPYEIEQLLDHVPADRLDAIEEYERANDGRDSVLDAVAAQRARA